MKLSEVLRVRYHRSQMLDLLRLSMAKCGGLVNTDHSLYSFNNLIFVISAVVLKLGDPGSGG